jgi:diguanylate cyclase (GGDEF)-like protein
VKLVDLVCPDPSAAPAVVLVDGLTGLHTRPAFALLADQRFLEASRSGKPVALIHADVDGMGVLNERFGADEGDRVLLAVTALLRDTFRACDVIARVGADSFAALPVGSAVSVEESCVLRLRRRLEALNAGPNRPYELRLHLIVTRFDPLLPRTAEELLHRAELGMVTPPAPSGT